MLKAHTCRQTGDVIKTWYSAPDHDLFVWQDTRGNILAFQFSYDKNHNEHLLSWSEHQGYGHVRIDDGEDVQMHIKMSPIMVANGQPDTVGLAERFRRVSTNLPEELVAFVCEKMLSCRLAGNNSERSPSDG